METKTSPRLKKLKSPALDASNNIKNCVTCTNVPESLFDAAVAKKHFSKFGRVHRITLFPKRQTCIIEYDQLASVQRAVLNAGAFDGFQFDVTRTKPRVRRHSKKDDDPEWLPDSDVEKELSAMGGLPTYRALRQKPMDLDAPKPTRVSKVQKQLPVKKIMPTRELQHVFTQPSSSLEPLVSVTTAQTSLSTAEAAIELHQLGSRISLTADEQWRTLDARDRILRQWGGAGARVKVGGATIGTCRDMCPEKERLHRQAEHQVMTLESLVDSDGALDQWRAVKQYSRSSADQEMPMCYELRPAPVLLATCAYLLHEVADTQRQVTLADWFHFLWDRLRGIRKDITQQALCCAESICLVEMCARFHAHCAARLADLEHTQFDQKLNTDNLTKCLQTLKHMYADVGISQKPREAEFRGYIALLNLGDSNFWWEIKQLPDEIQKSEPITFAIKIFNALDNNNYVRFFRLIRERATYLQACILLRYFNDVRARALARIVKAFAPRGGSRYPARELVNCLAFETPECMKAFINHYGLRCGKIDETELTVILDRNHFIEDSDPYPIAREMQLIESKRRCSVGEVIAGGQLPSADYKNHILQSSFTKDGTLKGGYLTGEELGYDTFNDTNKDVRALKAELQKVSQGGRNYYIEKAIQTKPNNAFIKPESKTFISKVTPPKPFTGLQNSSTKFSFHPAIPVAPTEIIKKSPEKIFEPNSKNIFSFSKPVETTASNLWSVKDSTNLFKPPVGKFDEKTAADAAVFGKANIENKDPFKSSQYINKGIVNANENYLFKKADVDKSVFGQISEQETKPVFGMPQKIQSGDINIFKKPVVGTSVFGQINSDKESKIFGMPQKTSGDSLNTAQSNKNIFSAANSQNVLFNQPSTKFVQRGNIFAKPVEPINEISNDPKSVFGAMKPNVFSQSSKVEQSDNAKSLSMTNGELTTGFVSPGSLFKNVMQPQNNKTSEYSIFQSKNHMKPTSVAANIFNSVTASNNQNVYDFDQQNENLQSKNEEKRIHEEAKKEHERMEELKRQQQKIEETRKLQDEIKRREESIKIEENNRLQKLKSREEQSRREEQLRKKQEELKKKLEEEKRLAEIERKANEKKFREKVDNESSELIDELLAEINTETVAHHLKEEMKLFNDLMSHANVVTNEIISELCVEICEAETKAEKIWAEKLMKKWFKVWRTHLLRNLRRRKLLESTPVWITERSPEETSNFLKRLVEDAALKNMNAVHRGYRFSGELKLLPTPSPYNLMNIIKSPLLKRMKQINYPYDKCFFWKITLVSPGSTKWLCKKVEIKKWLLDVFSDKKNHETSDSLIHVEKQSWNNLMDFAISISLANTDNNFKYSEALEGSNALLFYNTEDENNLIETIEETIKHRYPYQIIPIAVIIPKLKEATIGDKLKNFLNYLANSNSISCYKIFTVDPKNVCNSLNTCTKSALKWLAKNYPPIPPLEIDQLKSLCQRYLGNEVWCRLKLERETHLRHVLRDLVMLVKIYNIAVDKLTQILTNEDLFNYPSFPLEFKQYLSNSSPYPKPNEFIPSNVKTSENVSAIKDLMKQLRLPDPQMDFQPMSVVSMQNNIRTYCNQIGWFSDPEEVVCKVVAVLPNEFSNENLTSDQFIKMFEEHDLLDILIIIVYEKINNLKNFDNRFAIYEKSALEEYRNCHWWFNTEIILNKDQQALDYVDDIDYVIEAKRRKISQSCLDLTFEEKDCTMVEENIKANVENISRYTNYEAAVKQLEIKVEEERIRSLELENLLRSTLSNV